MLSCRYVNEERGANYCQCDLIVEENGKVINHNAK